jgi:hypothetical protein
MNPQPLQVCDIPARGSSEGGDAGSDAALDAAAEFDDAGATRDASVPDARPFDGGLADGGLTDPPSVLAAAVGCSSVGLWLSEDTGYAYEGCDAVCAASLCEQAITHLWQQVLDADTTERTLQISAAGRASLDKRAHVIGLIGGEWIGTTDLFQTEPKGTLQGCTESVSR